MKAHGGEGRPDDFRHKTKVYEHKVMVFVGLTGTGRIFGIKFISKNEVNEEDRTMNGPNYLAHLRNRCIPELMNINEE